MGKTGKVMIAAPFVMLALSLGFGLAIHPKPLPIVLYVPTSITTPLIWIEPLNPDLFIESPKVKCNWATREEQEQYCLTEWL